MGGILNEQDRIHFKTETKRGDPPRYTPSLPEIELHERASAKDRGGAAEVFFERRRSLLPRTSVSGGRIVVNAGKVMEDLVLLDRVDQMEARILFD